MKRVRYYSELSQRWYDFPLSEKELFRLQSAAIRGAVSKVCVISSPE